MSGPSSSPRRRRRPPAGPSGPPRPDRRPKQSPPSGPSPERPQEIPSSVRSGAAWRTVLSKELQRAERIAIVGIGNPDRGDDGAGHQAAIELAGPPALPPHALVVPGGLMPENFTGVLRAFGPRLVLLLDCASSGRRPGSLFLVPPEDMADADVSTHRIPLGRLWRYIHETICERVVVIGIEPASFAGPGLTPAVRRAVLRLASLIRRSVAASWRARSRRVRSSSA